MVACVRATQSDCVYPTLSQGFPGGPARPAGSAQAASRALQSGPAGRKRRRAREPVHVLASFLQAFPMFFGCFRLSWPAPAASPSATVHAYFAGGGPSVLCMKDGGEVHSPWSLQFCKSRPKPQAQRIPRPTISRPAMSPTTQDPFSKCRRTQIGGRRVTWSPARPGLGVCVCVCVVGGIESSLRGSCQMLKLAIL